MTANKNSLYSEWLESKDYFDSLAVLSDGPLHPGRFAANTLLAQRLSWESLTILDVGAGSGWSQKFFSSLGARVVALEPNKFMRHIAMRNGVDPSMIIPAGLEEFSESQNTIEEKFDRILIQGVLGFIKGDPFALLARLMRISSASELVLVDWVGPAKDFAGAPVHQTYSASTILKRFEDQGIHFDFAELFDYKDTRQDRSDNQLFSKIKFAFPEAEEIGFSEIIREKFHCQLYHEHRSFKKFMIAGFRR
jgi:hypothetical protein